MLVLKLRLISGILAIVWSGFWFLTIAETPGDDKRITKEELTYIQSSLGFTFENVKVSGFMRPFAFIRCPLAFQTLLSRTLPF